MQQVSKTRLNLPSHLARPGIARRYIYCAPSTPAGLPAGRRRGAPSFSGCRWLLWVGCWFAGAAAEEGAPYRTIAAAAVAASAIIETLAAEDATAALARAYADSHQDDPRVQKNLTWAATGLPAQIAPLGAVRKIENTGTDRFMSAFVRFNFRIRYAGGDLRIMLTYRRKTAGWRLNQFYFDG